MSDMYPKKSDKAAEKPEMPWKKGTKMGGFDGYKTSKPIFTLGKKDPPAPILEGYTEYKSKDGDTIWVPDKKN